MTLLQTMSPAASRLRRFFCGCFAALLAVILCALLLGASTSVPPPQRVWDNARLLGEQVPELESRIAAMRESRGIDFGILTIDDAEGKTARDYADGYFLESGMGTGEELSGALFLIDMEHREAYIAASGKAIDYLTDMRVESILDAAYEGLSQGDFAAAADSFLKEADAYIGLGVPENQYQYDTETGETSGYQPAPGEQLAPPEEYERQGGGAGVWAFSGIAGLGAGGLCCWRVKSKYKMKAPTYNYPFRQNGTLALTRNEDTLVNKAVTFRQIPRTPPGGYGGSGPSSSPGRSSTHSFGGGGGGHTFSGGGRKF